LIPTHRLTYYQSRVLDQDKTFFRRTGGKGFNLKQTELRDRISKCYQQLVPTGESIDFNHNDEWLIDDTGYALRFNRKPNI